MSTAALTARERNETRVTTPPMSFSTASMAYTLSCQSFCSLGER
ncbi:hypothetical protein [Noviherbaspirillum cavernae]|nr:hypothetical protein [Noviherbaspirillum cavernae]